MEAGIESNSDEEIVADGIVSNLGIEVDEGRGERRRQRLGEVEDVVGSG
jgi:hypothetical protein